MKNLGRARQSPFQNWLSDIRESVRRLGGWIQYPKQGKLLPNPVSRSLDGQLDGTLGYEVVWEEHHENTKDETSKKKEEERGHGTSTSDCFSTSTLTLLVQRRVLSFSHFSCFRDWFLPYPPFHSIRDLAADVVKIHHVFMVYFHHQNMGYFLLTNMVVFGN